MSFSLTLWEVAPGWPLSPEANWGPKRPSAVGEGFGYQILCPRAVIPLQLPISSGTVVRTPRPKKPRPCWKQLLPPCSRACLRPSLVGVPRQREIICITSGHSCSLNIWSFKIMHKFHSLFESLGLGNQGVRTLLLHRSHQIMCLWLNELKGSRV